MTSRIQRRKDEHLDLCATEDVAFREQTTLLECVKLAHRSLPELSLEEVDLSVDLLGKKLRAPLIISGMTGGTERAAVINRALAEVAQERGYAFGLGSQRAMIRDPESAWTYEVRKWAPDILLLGNVGVVQARDLPSEPMEELVQQVGADALCVHMNPAMELIQQDGDRDFRGCLETFGRLVEELSVPVVAKETGCGVSAETAAELFKAGVRTVDVAGAGGTSWVGVETLRAEGTAQSVGAALWDWGIPTAASVHLSKAAGLDVIASGGVQSGLDVARAIALGADAAGLARRVFQAFEEGGASGASAFLDTVEAQLRTVMLLCGARTVRDLQRVPRVIAGDLKEWISRANDEP